MYQWLCQVPSKDDLPPNNYSSRWTLLRSIAGLCENSIISYYLVTIADPVTLAPKVLIIRSKSNDPSDLQRFGLRNWHFVTSILAETNLTTNRGAGPSVCVPLAVQKSDSNPTSLSELISLSFRSVLFNFHILDKRSDYVMNQRLKTLCQFIHENLIILQKISLLKQCRFSPQHPCLWFNTV